MDFILRRGWFGKTRVVAGSRTLDAIEWSRGDKQYFSFRLGNDTWQLNCYGKPYEIETNTASVFRNEDAIAEMAWARLRGGFNATQSEWRLTGLGISGIMRVKRYMAPRWSMKFSLDGFGRIAFGQMGCGKMRVVYRPSMDQLLPILVMVVLREMSPPTTISS
jgi:hypothetical protein